MRAVFFRLFPAIGRLRCTVVKFAHYRAHNSMEESTSSRKTCTVVKHNDHRAHIPKEHPVFSDDTANCYFAALALSLFRFVSSC